MAPNRTLVPLSRPDLIGLGVGRRTLGRYILNPPDVLPAIPATDKFGPSSGAGPCGAAVSAKSRSSAC